MGSTESNRYYSFKIITRITAAPTVVADLVQQAREKNVSFDTLEFLGAGGAKRPAAQVGVEKQTCHLQILPLDME